MIGHWFYKECYLMTYACIPSWVLDLPHISFIENGLWRDVYVVFSLKNYLLCSCSCSNIYLGKNLTLAKLKELNECVNGVIMGLLELKK